MPHPNRLIATAAGCAVAIAAASAGTALAADAGTPTQITVSPTTVVHAGTIATFDAPGVKAIRRGKAIPKGYVLVKRSVQVTRGTNVAGASMRFLCPDNKRLQTFGVTGNAGFFAPTSYADHRSTVIVSLPPGNSQHTDGSIFAVCR